MDPIQWAHSFKQRRPSVAFEEWGAWGLKTSHHFRLDRDDEARRAFLIGKWGEGLYLECYRKNQETFGGSVPVSYYRSVIAGLRARLAQLRAAS